VPHYSGSSKIKEGWVLNQNFQPLFWVPPSISVGLYRPSNITIIGKVIKTRLDIRRFVHGEDWVLCGR